jgi:hypothetical protein
VPPAPPVPLLFLRSGSSILPEISDDGVLSQDELSLLVGAAIARWEATGLTSEQVALLRNVVFEVTNLNGAYLGLATPGHVVLDDDGAANNWFVDTTPLEDSEYAGAGTSLTATSSGGAAARVDALTTVMHELGHQLGLDDTYAAADQASLMYGYLSLSERRLPASGQAAGADPAAHADAEGPDYLTMEPSASPVASTDRSAAEFGTEALARSFGPAESDPPLHLTDLPSARQTRQVIKVDSSVLVERMAEDLARKSIGQAALSVSDRSEPHAALDELFDEQFDPFADELDPLFATLAAQR